jgi:hypothetical protein
MNKKIVIASLFRKGLVAGILFLFIISSNAITIQKQTTENTRILEI